MIRAGLDTVDWSLWTVILLKPDCLTRDLVELVLARVSREVQVTGFRIVEPTEEQIFAHYDDILHLSARLGVDVPGELRRIYVGRQAAVALGYGPGAAPRVRAMLGDTDPVAASPDTIRGRFGTDSLPVARARGQLIDNLIHTSDTTRAVPRDFAIWYGPAHAHLLTTPPEPAQPAVPTARPPLDTPGRTP
jgi:nucleoside-diphosphate kinase